MANSTYNNVATTTDDDNGDDDPQLYFLLIFVTIGTKHAAYRESIDKVEGFHCSL